MGVFAVYDVRGASSSRRRPIQGLRCRHGATLNRRTTFLGILGIAAAIGFLIGLEIYEEPDITLGEILMELIEVSFLVLSGAEWSTC